MLDAMGVELWLERAALTQAVPAPAPAIKAPPAEAKRDGSALHTLREAVAACTACPLHQSRTQTVFGVGNANARLMVIGEAPGAEEDRRGEPFVGRAGQLLNAMLAAIGLTPEEIFIANILKCRPPNNRDPAGQEVAACNDFLKQQIALVRPQLVLAVGRIAAQNLLQQEIPIGRMRGTVYAYGEAEIPLVVTYHPAYLLRSPLEKRKAWQDLKLVQTKLEPQEKL